MSELKNILRHTIGDGNTDVVESFAKSFAYNLAQKPVSAIVQEVNETAHCKLLPKLEFMSPLPVVADGTAAWKAQKAGEVLAVVPWLLLGNKALRRVECLSDTGIAMSTARAAIAGDIYGTILQPVQDRKNFYTNKLENGLIIGASAATFTALQKGIGGEQNLSSGRQFLAGETAGLGAGFVNENARSLIDHKRLLSLSQDNSFIAPYAVLGTAAAITNLSLLRNAQGDLSTYVKRDDLVWDLPRGGIVARNANAARRAEDLATGQVVSVKDSGIFEEFAGKGKWQVFRDRSDKQLLIDKSTKTVAKIFNAEDLADQAAAMKKIHAEFGVTVPQNVVLHTAADKAALTMSYVEHKTGEEVFVLANTKPAFGFRNRQAEYRDLYQQGEQLASRIHRSLDDKLFFADMHDENWGFKPETIRSWRVGKTLNPQDMVVTDPVTGWIETQSRHAL